MTHPTPKPDERIGTTVADKYRIVKLLGSGGMGSVYEAENTSIGKRVALKFLLVSADTDPTLQVRFQREARVISAVRSAHVVELFDWGQDAQGQPFLVMELLEGGDLASHIEHHGKLSVRHAVRFAVEALRGLRKVHGAGIVHRDLKPENLFLCTGDDDLKHVKIVDFGLSKLLDTSDATDFVTSARLTQQGTLVGTPLYMSPEQIEAVAELDERTDIWAMGAITYEMLSGSPPFMAESYARLVMAICQRDPIKLSSINPEVSPQLEAIVGKALARDRDQRFASVDEFCHALLRIDLAAVSAPATTPQVQIVSGPARIVTSGQPGGPASGVDETLPSQGGPLDATLAAHTRGAATVWLSDAPVFSIWRGEVDSPDRLRVEARDGSIRDLRLEPVGPLTLGRVKTVGAVVNDLVYPDVASRLAAKLRHDGMRWWLMRRPECSVPVQVGNRNLKRGEEASLVHGAFLTVGAMRATFVDRRYVSRSVPAGTVDNASGLMARGGLEQEAATAMQHEDTFGIALVLSQAQQVGTPPSPAVSAVMAVHRQWPSDVVARVEDGVALLVRGNAEVCAATVKKMRDVVMHAGVGVLSGGYWMLQGDAANAGSEVELALNGLQAAAAPGAGNKQQLVDLRSVRQGLRISVVDDVIARAQKPKWQLLLFGIEEQAALQRIGPKVVPALEQELAAIIVTQAGPSSMVATLAPGVVAACIPRKLDAPRLGIGVQCDWHARAPITDGKVELPRTLSWEHAAGAVAADRARELSRECRDAHGVLSALSGGLPHPIAGRVHAAIGAASAVERVKMLFDVLEGTWRFIAVVLASAYFSKNRKQDGAGVAGMRGMFDRVRTRSGLPLGVWRELARLAAKGFTRSDPVGQLAHQLLDVKLGSNQTFDALSNLMHSERNNFAHSHYNEARAAADVTEFEQMTRSFLRALRPLCAWTLVTVQRTEPDLYGESQTVDFIDHTGPYSTGARRRIGFTSPIRLANVVYLARWRDGLVLPLDPWLQRLASDDRFDLYWMDHLPRSGVCNMSTVVSGAGLQAPCDPRRLAPMLREFAAGTPATGR